MIETRVLPVHPYQPEPETIQMAADVLREGHLVAFPTETVYGLGANALDAAAINRIYEAKRRPATDPIIAHIYHTSQLVELTLNLPEVVQPLAETFWPGPLTLILNRAASVPANIATGMNTIAVRMPSHPVAQALIQAAQVPVAAPSANTFTRPSATTAAHVLEDLNGRIHLVLDGGPATIGIESTVLDLTGAVPLVLRPGGVTLEALQKVVPDVMVRERFIREDEATSSPGQMLKHYSPDARVIVYTGAGADAALRAACEDYIRQGQRVGVLASAEAAYADGVIVRRLGADLPSISHQLFAALRELDMQRVDVILVADFGREGLGAAVWDRLVRAAEGNVIRAD